MLKDLLNRTGDHAGPLPASLRDRLKGIPRAVVVCRDRDRLYRAARQRARGDRPEEAAAEHLAACERCAALYGTLEEAFSEEPPRPSARLSWRLKAIARRPARRMPPWISDSRYATAACLLLAVFLTAAADDAAAVLGGTAGKVSSRAAVWVEKGGAQGRQAWMALEAAFEEAYSESRELLEDLARSCEELFHETVRTFGALVTKDPKKPDKGDDDGDAKPESA